MNEKPKVPGRVKEDADFLISISERRRLWNQLRDCMEWLMAQGGGYCVGWRTNNDHIDDILGRLEVLEHDVAYTICPDCGVHRPRDQAKCQCYPEKMKTDSEIAKSHEDHKKLNEMDTKLTEIKNDILKGRICGTCGGVVILIRGRYPGNDQRRVCPTCVVEKLDDIVEQTTAHQTCSEIKE